MGKHVLIAGGGVQGAMIAYDLVQHGHHVTLVEASPSLGGLASSMTIPEVNLEVDRFYHCILSSDTKLLALLDELNLKEKLRFTTTGMSFYGKTGQMHSMSSPLEFLRFPLLSLPSRIRLGLGLLYSAWIKDGSALENLSVETWLRQVTGHEAYEELWGPLLQSKFDQGFQDIPASYMWARLRRMLSTRDKTSGEEQMGHLIGGYQTLIDALARKIEPSAQILTQHRITGLTFDTDGACSGATIEDQTGQTTSIEADHVVLTVHNPRIQKLLGDRAPEETLTPLKTIGYMSILCPLLVLDRSLSPYYTINIVDRSLDMTGVIETTRIISPDLLGGRHLVYLPRYTSPGHPLFEASDEDILERSLRYLQNIIPDFSPQSILASRVLRARYTEPIHTLSPQRTLVPYRSGVPGVSIANSTQVHPDLVNCEAMAHNVARALRTLHTDLGTPGGATSLSAP